jgi:hypothetical protein
MAEPDLSLIDEEALGAWLVEQRWFASKAADGLVDPRARGAPLGGDEEPQMALAPRRGALPGGTHELYHLPLGFRHVDEGWTDGVSSRPATARCTTRWTTRRARERLMTALAAEARTRRRGAPLALPARPRAASPSRASSTRSARRRRAVELLDGVRRAADPQGLPPHRAGPNPELELLRFLTTTAFTTSRGSSGWYEHTGRLVDATLGLHQEFLPGAQDGWALALDGFERDGGQAPCSTTSPSSAGSTGELHATLPADAERHDVRAGRSRSMESLALLVATIDERSSGCSSSPRRTRRSPRSAGAAEEVRERVRCTGSSARPGGSSAPTATTTSGRPC